jgi:hypothetical protein
MEQTKVAGPVYGAQLQAGLNYRPDYRIERFMSGPRADSSVCRTEVPRVLALRVSVAAIALTVSALAGGLLSGPSLAQQQADTKLDNRVAVFSALDKVTATIKTLEVPINETVQFGALKVTPRVCYSRPATEQPKTTSFVEVDEVQLDGNEKRIFTGWMFAQSPGLNAVEHPVFDVWLTECQKPRNAVAQQAPPPAEGAPDASGAEDGGWASEPSYGEEPAEQRRRVRR